MTKTKSVRTKFVIISVLSITIILSLFGIFQYQGRKIELTQRLNASLTAATTRLTLTLPSSIWAFDTEAAKSTILSELGEEAILGAAVLLNDNTKSIFIGLIKQDAEKIDFDPATMVKGANEYDVETTLTREGVPIATLVIRHSTEFIHKELTDDIFSRIVQILVISLGLSIIVFLLISRMIIKPIAILGKNMYEIAQGEGDMTKDLPVRGNNEISGLSSSFNIFQAKLSSIINKTRASFLKLQDVGYELNSSATQTAASLHEITANISSIRKEITRQSSASQTTADTTKAVNEKVLLLCERIDTQFHSIQISSSAIEEMVANIKSVSSIVENLDAEHTELVNAAENGRQRLDQVNERVTTIMANSENLEEANVLIASIASQTNLLAMNAAIEAAHAGEYGKGFSVVADEIRKLAEHSSEQSKTTSAMLKEISNSIQTADTASKEAEKSFQSIMDHLHKTTALEQQIDLAMKEQTTGSTQILENLQSINDSSITVRESANDINQLNKRITTEIETLNQISYQVLGSIDEITLGTEEVNKAASSISDLSMSNRDIADQASRDLSVFKTRTENTTQA